MSKVNGDCMIHYVSSACVYIKTTLIVTSPRATSDASIEPETYSIKNKR